MTHLAESGPETRDILLKANFQHSATIPCVLQCIFLAIQMIPFQTGQLCLSGINGLATTRSLFILAPLGTDVNVKQDIAKQT